MKKIIATVLAMVMALALCTTAFAATTTNYEKGYEKDGDEITLTGGGSFVVVTVSAVKDTSVKGYKVSYTTASGSAVSEKPYVAATAADYDLKLTADGRATLYLSEAPNTTLNYVDTAVAYTNIGDKCEQLDMDTDDKYYSSTDDDGNITIYVAADSGNNILVNGKLVSVSGTTYDDSDLEEHNWKAASYNEDGTVATYKCKDCGTVATVYKTVDAAVAAGMTTTTTVNGDVIGYKYGTDSSSDTKKSDSPKTFDAGIAMYVGMALTSVAGSAVVIGKKKEF